MNIKLSVCLVAISSILYGCSTISTPDSVFDSVVAPNTIENDNKVVGDGSHLKLLPMSRDFLMDSPDNFQAVDADFRKIGSKGNKKIFSIKPTGDTKPRTVILLENNIIPSSVWDWRDYNFRVKSKNIEICKGFMKLQTVEDIENEGKKDGEILKADKNNHVITYMLAKGENKNNLPKYPEDCNDFISKGYDYASASEELYFILGDNKLGKSPYLAIYESPESLYSSMILSVGELSPEAIALLSSQWSELVMNVYQKGKIIEPKEKFDPRVGIAIMLKQSSALQSAENQAVVGNIKIGVTAGMCGGALAASTITLNTLFATPVCAKFIKDAATALGYEVPFPL